MDLSIKLDKYLACLRTRRVLMAAVDVSIVALVAMHLARLMVLLLAELSISLKLIRLSV